jgi:hypothetical protein
MAVGGTSRTTLDMGLIAITDGLVSLDRVIHQFRPVS